jgi:small subunit ribosomal protein S2
LIKNLDSSFSGVEEMTALPAAIFVVDPGAHDIAVREARRVNVPIVAIMSNDADPRGIAYPIPANDNARSSLSWIFARLESRLS